jgi:hypothetical protein
VTSAFSTAEKAKRRKRMRKIKLKWLVEFSTQIKQKSCESNYFKKSIFDPAAAWYCAKKSDLQI